MRHTWLDPSSISNCVVPRPFEGTRLHTRPDAVLEMVVIELRISPKSSPNLSPQSSPESSP